jgi:toxin ParE1/3/4
MKPVKYHRLAESELVASALYYESRRKSLGDVFLDLVDETLADLRNNPAWGSPGEFETRSWKMRRFPFRLVYLEQTARIWIVAVAHLSRKPGYWSVRLE